VSAVLAMMAGAVRTGRLADCLLYRLLCGFVRLLARRGGERELEAESTSGQVRIPVGGAAGCVTTLGGATG
jgi:hypothetical protein